jgi:aryl-alcohol dehydrogenase-like predicted oxidoreductase/enamine deaminase RidA (YjgF/YER057c/UK114 family)
MTTQLGSLEICQVVNGLWQIADRERHTALNPREAASSLLPYVEAGLTTFDMADHYGSSEEIVGWFKRLYPQHSIQALTKWVPEPGAISKETVRTAVQRALKRLQSEQIDLMQFHAWNYADPSWLDGLFFLTELKQEGLIHELGVTNFDTAHLRVAVKSGIPIVSNQVCFSLIDQRAANEMTDLCLHSDVKLLAFGTLAGGFLSERWLEKAEPVMNDSLTWSQMKYKRFIDVAGGWAKFQSVLNFLQHLAQKKQTTIAMLASHAILQQAACGAVIVGTRLEKTDTLQQTEAIMDVFLSDAEKEEVSEAISNLQKIPGDCGDEYRKPPFLTASGDLSHHVKNFPKPYPIKTTAHQREHAISGTIWEELAGFSRAIKKGNRILISGTTATHESHAMGGDDAAAQAHFIIDKIEGALQSLGASLEQVVRTRIYIRHVRDWEAVARAHGVRFKDIQPANTMVRADLIGDEYLVEIEAEAEM